MAHCDPLKCASLCPFDVVTLVSHTKQQQLYLIILRLVPWSTLHGGHLTDLIGIVAIVDMDLLLISHVRSFGCVDEGISEGIG